MGLECKKIEIFVSIYTIDVTISPYALCPEP